MDSKPYWFIIAGLVLLLVFVLIIRMPYSWSRPSRRPSWKPSWRPSWNPATWLGPGGTRREHFANPATFTMFEMPGCGHCIKAKPQFASLGSTMTIGGTTVEMRNVQSDSPLVEEYGVTGFPTFFLDYAGKRTQYQGERSKSGFVEFLEKELSA